MLKFYQNSHSKSIKQYETYLSGIIILIIVLLIFLESASKYNINFVFIIKVILFLMQTEKKKKKLNIPGFHGSTCFAENKLRQVTQ